MARVCCVWVEAAAVVGDQQRHIGRTDLEHQVYVCGLGVFGYVV